MHLLLALSSFTAQAFAAGLWQGFVLVAAISFGLRLAPRLSPAVRFSVWSLTFALALALPMLHAAPHAAATGARPVVRLDPHWAVAIAGVWVALSALRLVQLFTQARHLRRIWRDAIPVAAGTSLPFLAASGPLLAASGRTAELCTSTAVDAPAVIGFFAPRLLIPENLYPLLTAAELHQIVLHECEHLRRRDDWINLAQKLALALYPLNPALLWVDRRLGLERELACDAGVVATTSAPFDYARNLTHLAEHRFHVRRIALALSAWSRESELARRVHRLLRPVQALSPMHARTSVAILGIVLTGGALELARAPRLIAFTEAVAPVIAVQTSTASPATPFRYPERGSERPRATLVKAVMPVAKPSTVKQRPRAKTDRPVARAYQIRTTAPSRQPRVLLTSALLPDNAPNVTYSDATDDAAPTERVERRPAVRTAPRTIYAVYTGFSPSYAAVPFGDGWLIIQL